MPNITPCGGQDIGTPNGAGRHATVYYYMVYCLAIGRQGLIRINGTFQGLGRPREAPCVLYQNLTKWQLLGAIAPNGVWEIQDGQIRLGGRILPGTLQTLGDDDSPTRQSATERSRSEPEIYRPGVPAVRGGAISGWPDSFG